VLQELSYPHLHWYRFGNFVFLVLGCCCIYSLFNVTSIVIKQALNWLIIRLDCRCFEDPTGAAGRLWRRQSMKIQQSMRRRRRRSSAGMPGNLRRQRKPNLAAGFGRRSAVSGVMSDNKTPDKDGDSDSMGYDSEGDATGRRRLSGEMISMKDFLQANKVSLAVMQKQLYETAQMQRGGCQYGNDRGYGSSGRRTPGSFTPGTVGPLAIVSQKLGGNCSAR
jgi:hypothetical protein